jgi:hypothetical protein
MRHPSLQKLHQHQTLEHPTERDMALLSCHFSRNREALMLLQHHGWHHQRNKHIFKSSQHYHGAPPISPERSVRQ